MGNLAVLGVLVLGYFKIAVGILCCMTQGILNHYSPNIVYFVIALGLQKAFVCACLITKRCLGTILVSSFFSPFFFSLPLFSFFLSPSFFFFSPSFYFLFLSLFFFLLLPSLSLSFFLSFFLLLPSLSLSLYAQNRGV